jgi:hypothetical protein
VLDPRRPIREADIPAVIDIIKEIAVGRQESRFSSASNRY